MSEKEFVLIPENLALNEPNPELLKLINNKVFDDKVLFELESNFHTIQVVENEVGRFLHYQDTYQAGFINTEVYKGNLPYINYFLIPYLLNPKIKNILLIGLGSGKIVSDFNYLFENISSIDVVDLEENIVDIAVNYFDFKIPKNFNFYLQDGITFLRTNKKKYDLIVVDVANNEGIDYRFLSDEYFNSIKKSLKKNGIFVSNMCASPDFKNKKNKFINEILPVYEKYFVDNKIFKGNYSDKVYYKSFFNIDERVIDITNVILISSDKNYKINDSEERKNKISNLNVEIENYLKDLVY